MRIDPYPLDGYLEHSAQARAMQKIRAREKPLGEPIENLTLADLDKYVGERLSASGHPLAEAARQRATMALAADEALRRHDLKRPRLAEHAEEKRLGLVQFIRDIERYAVTGEVADSLMVVVTDAAEKIVAEVTPANLDRDPIEDFAALAPQFGIERIPDLCDPGDGTERITFKRRKRPQFSREQIETSAHRIQREMLIASKAQRVLIASDALRVIDVSEVTSLLPFADDTAREIAAIFSRLLCPTAHVAEIDEASGMLAVPIEVSAVPLGP